MKLLIYVAVEVDAESIAPGLWVHPIYDPEPYDEGKWVVSHQTGLRFAFFPGREEAIAAAERLAALQNWRNLTVLDIWRFAEANKGVIRQALYGVEPDPLLSGKPPAPRPGA